MSSTHNLAPHAAVLPDVSLAAIVRDETINAAYGIIDFVHSTLPFVQEAVIVDTGSKDGTRQALGALQAQYPHLRVFDRQFDNYASSRNYSLAQVRTRYVLVLDADERIRAQDFTEIAKLLRMHPAEGYNFRFMNRYLEAKDDDIMWGHNPRLFLKKGKRYKNLLRRYNELLYTKYGTEVQYLRSVLTCDHIVVNHFQITGEIQDKKNEGWQAQVDKRVSPSANGSIADLPQSYLWRVYNPRREEFR